MKVEVLKDLWDRQFTVLTGGHVMFPYVFQHSGGDWSWIEARTELMKWDEPWHLEIQNPYNASRRRFRFLRDGYGLPFLDLQLRNILHTSIPSLDLDSIGKTKLGAWKWWSCWAGQTPTLWGKYPLWKAVRQNRDFVSETGVYFSRNTHVHAGDNKLIINGSINCYLILNPTGLYGDSLWLMTIVKTCWKGQSNRDPTQTKAQCYRVMF